MENDFRQVGGRHADRNTATVPERAPDGCGRSPGPEEPLTMSRSERWRSRAAYITWLAIATHVVLRLVYRGPTLPNLVGTGLFTLSIGVGLYQLHRRPALAPTWMFRVLILIQTTAALAAMALLTADTLAILLIVIVAHVSEREKPPVMAAWLIAANTGLLAIHLYQFSWFGAVIRTGMQLGFQFFTVSISLALAGERSAKEQLAGLNAELIATRRLLSESTRAQERLRISRELHDVAGHHLTALKLNLESSLRKNSNPAVPAEDLQDRLTLCRDLTGQLLDEIRSVVHQLRATEDLDLRRALEPLTAQLPDTTVQLDISPKLSVSRIEVAETIVRCAQEAITNALKHGGAQRVWITLVQEGDEIKLTVKDDGTGGPSDQPGHGLRGMSERATSLGGTLKIVTPRASGWELQLILPEGSAP